MICLAHTVHQSYVKISTISKRTTSSFHLSLVPRSTIGCIQNDFWGYVMTGTICVHSTNTYTISKQTERGSTWATSPRSCIRRVQIDFQANGTFGANHAPILHQDQHYLKMNWNELPLEPHNLGEPSGASKMISEHVVCLAHSIHLSYTDTNTISKRTEMRFHMTHVPRRSI
jgi:hypothetical protein